MNLETEAYEGELKQLRMYHSIIKHAVMRRLRSAARIVADGEQRIIAANNNFDEIMVEEADGTYNRYRKVTD